jgi:hypothetical protein
MEHSKTFETGEIQDILINDFVLVKYATKKTKVPFAGQVEENEARPSV